ncbi:hypothetical protein BKA70DRAFT_1243711 [Coprinopsis sp. MPI-PUGE-AT-0042]|nr:hypothetical protein BKA70DRAFT_1243711 [Coprinopsis sp. MPI-PUGE-AT-0042]
MPAFIDESARDVEDDWKRNRIEEDNDGEELNERVSVNKTSSLLRIRSEAVAWPTEAHLHDQANIASGEIKRPFATSIASKSAPSSLNSEALRHPAPLSGPSSSSNQRHPLCLCPRPFVPPSTQVSLQRVARTSETGQWHANSTYRNDIGLIVDVAENVATTYVVPRIGDPDAPRRRGSKRFFTSKEVQRYVRSGRDFTYENSLGFDRWTLGEATPAIFKCGFEVLSLKTGYSGPGELPTVEEFQLFYTNHCPHLDTQEGLELLERTARLLLPPISPRERCEIARRSGGGPAWFPRGHCGIRRRCPGCTVTALDVESCSEVTFLKDFLVFHNEAFTPMGDDAHRWLSVGHINRAPNGVQIGDMCEVIRGPEAGAKGRLIDKIGRPSSVAYDSYRMTYGLELDVADKGTRALVEVDGQYRLIIAPTKDLKLLTEYMPLTGADVSRLVGSHPHLSTIIPVQTMLDDLPDRFTRFIGYRVTVIGTHHLKGSQGWLRAVSMDVAVCELDHSAVFSKATHQLHVDKIGVYCSTSRKWVKLEDAIRPNRRGITMVYEKEVPGSVWDPDPQKTNGCELSKWIEWFPALASALPTPGLLVKLEAPFIMFHGNPNVWRIMKLNGSAAPSLVYGVEGVLVSLSSTLQRSRPIECCHFRPSEVQRPYEALVVHRRHEFFGRVVLVKPCDSPRVWVVSLPTGKDKRKFRLEDEDLVLYGRFMTIEALYISYPF